MMNFGVMNEMGSDGNIGLALYCCYQCWCIKIRIACQKAMSKGVL